MVINQPVYLTENHTYYKLLSEEEDILGLSVQAFQNLITRKMFG